MKDNTFKKWLLYLFLIALMAAMIIFLNSCNTLKQSQTRLFKVDRDHPELLADYCAEKYPVKVDSFTKEIYKKGEIIKESDTFYVNCDEVKDSVTKIIKVPYIKTIRQTDTVERTVTITKENTAALQAEIGKHKETAAQLNKTQGSLKTTRTISIILGILLLVMGIILFIVAKAKINLLK